MYTEIVFIGDNLDRFALIERSDKPQEEKSALETLSRIQHILDNRLIYSKERNDSFSKMKEEVLYKELKKKAKIIHDNYLKKSQKIISIRKFLRCNIEQFESKEKAIQEIYKNIEKFTPPSTPFLLPEVFQLISKSSNIKFAKRLEQVSREIKNYLSVPTMQRAQEIGYKGNNLNEANDYIKNVFPTIELLTKDGFIPNEYVVQKRHFFWNYINYEETLKKITHLSGEEEKNLKSKLNLALLHYVKNGNSTVIRGLLQLGADLETRDYKGHTPLAIASKKGQKEAVETLINAGANVNALNNRGSPPLLLAVYFAKSEEICQLLLNNGAKETINLNNNIGCNALHCAAEMGLDEIVKVLVTSGADLERGDIDGHTPLALAAKNGQKKVLEYLITAKADVNALNNHGSTPLLLAVYYAKSEEICRLLLDNGAKETINLNNNSGKNALHKAVDQDLPKIVRDC